MFDLLGRIIARKPWWIVGAWIVIAVAGAAWAWQAEKPPPDDMGSFLPPGAPYNVAVEQLAQAFPRQASRSSIALIVRRPAGLTEADVAWLDRLTREAGAATENRTLSPALPFLRPRLLSRDGQAGMAIVNLSTNMISEVSGRAVQRTEELIAERPPPTGLTVELTGSAAIGRDYGIATKQALDRTTWVTVVAVLGILVLVYRSPVGAFVPLTSIGLSVYVAFVLLAMLASVGFRVSSMERIFAVVLIFGAGVDYALFWIARYREGLLHAPDYTGAAHEATRHAGPAILASAMTTIFGLTTMLVADLGPSRGAGKVLAVVLTVALLAGLTLAPAVARLLGAAMFWPVGAAARPAFAQRLVWPMLADRVARRPAAVLAGGCLLLVVPAVWSIWMVPRFDSLSELPPGTTSSRGFDIAQAHFSKGQLYSNALLLVFDRAPGSPERLREASRELTQQILKIPGVEDVYSLDSPLGRSFQMPDRTSGGLAGLLSNVTGVDVSLAGPVRQLYLADAPAALRFEVLIESPPFSLEAMQTIEQARAVARTHAARFTDAGVTARVHVTGLTPYIMAVRDVSGRDQIRVMVLATALIALIVFLLIRDLPLTVFMVLATWLTYGATLKLTELFFLHVMGLQGVDWKVRLIVFVIVVAVGQDYNIFLVSRLMEERRRADDRDAVRRSVVSTGSVISSCGIIMAATLGSLWAGGLSLLRQVGFALALGILIDTYFVRPLLIPSFFLVWRGWKSRQGGAKTQTDDGDSTGRLAGSKL